MKSFREFISEARNPWTGRPTKTVSLHPGNRTSLKHISGSSVGDRAKPTAPDPNHKTGFSVLDDAKKRHDKAAAHLKHHDVKHGQSLLSGDINVHSDHLDHAKSALHKAGYKEHDHYSVKDGSMRNSHTIKVHKDPD